MERVTLAEYPCPVFGGLSTVFKQSIKAGKHFGGNPSGRKTSGLGYILSGSCVYKWENRSFKAEEGDLLFLPRGSIYSMDIISEYSYIFVNFDFIGTDMYAFVPEVYKIRNSAALHGIFHRILKVYNAKPPEYYAECMSLLYSVFMHVQREKSAPYMPFSKRQSIAQAADYMHNSYTDPRTSVAGAASAAGMSVTHFRRLFRAVYSVCPSDYLNELRISSAKELLAVSGINIGDIAEKCGFSSLYYFSRLFRQKTGITPSEYRSRYSEIFYITSKDE